MTGGERNVLGQAQNKSAQDIVCCVKNSFMDDVEVASVDFKSDDLLKERGEMDCKMSGCDLRDIPEVGGRRWM